MITVLVRGLTSRLITYNSRHVPSGGGLDRLPKAEASEVTQSHLLT